MVSYTASTFGHCYALVAANLVLDPEPSICSDLSDFVEQLNVFFGQPDLAQASEMNSARTQNARLPTCEQIQIEFSKHATHTGWNDAALYGEFY